MSLDKVKQIIEKELVNRKVYEDALVAVDAIMAAKGQKESLDKQTADALKKLDLVKKELDVENKELEKVKKQSEELKQAVAKELSAKKAKAEEEAAQILAQASAASSAINDKIALEKSNLSEIKKETAKALQELDRIKSELAAVRAKIQAM